MILVTSAVGESYQREAVRLRATVSEHGWRSPLTIVSDTPIPGVPTVEAEETLWGGRGLKSRFAILANVPDDEPVAWVDADCIATGDEPVWEELPPNTVAGCACFVFPDGSTDSKLYLADVLKPRFPVEPKPGSIHFSSFFLQFDSGATAKRLCRLWYDRLCAQEQRDTDEIALFSAILELGINQRQLSQANRANGLKQAYPTLQHPSRP